MAFNLIYDVLESGRGENELTDYNLLVGLFYTFDSWESYGEDTLDGVKKFKEKLKKDINFATNNEFI